MSAMRCARFLAAATLAAGCATVGPHVTKQEVKDAREELQVKSLQRRADFQLRVWRIAHELFEAMPSQEQGPFPELGVAVAPIDRTARKAFGFPARARGLYVFAVRNGGPAEAAGIRQQDVLVSIGGKACTSLRRFERLTRELRPGDAVTVVVVREGNEMPMPVSVGSRPMRVNVVVSRDVRINAWARGHHEIGVTSGLVRFLDSDDELAVVLGHELAHVASHHREKHVAAGVAATAIGFTLGAATEVAVPGSGAPVMHATVGLTQSAFSRDLEREADYRGLLYAQRAGFDIQAGITVWERFGLDLPGSLTAGLRATHPATPERLVRIRKIAAMLTEKQERPDEDVVPERAPTEE